MALDLNKNIIFCDGAFRRFYKGERHVTRVFDKSVLLLVSSGVLRFGENGEQKEVKAGEYYIQRANISQDGEIISDSPEYYYVHFIGEFTDDENGLNECGAWDETTTLPLIKRLDEGVNGKATLLQKSILFLSLLQELNNYNAKKPNELARTVMKYIVTNYDEKITLDELSKQTFVSQNHLIAVFRREYDVTPHKYLTELRLGEAYRLLRDSERTEEDIASSVGYDDYSVFYKAFKKKYGFSPYKVREKNQ